MDNPFPTGRVTEVKINSVYNYVLIMKEKKKPKPKQKHDITKRIPEIQGSYHPLLLALQKAKKSTGIVFKYS